MKKIWIMTMMFLAGTATAITASSCSESKDLKDNIKATVKMEIDDNDSSSKDMKIVTQVRDVKNFSGIRIEGAPTVIYTQGSEFSVKVKGIKEVVDATIVKVNGSTLIVRIDDKFSWKTLKNIFRNGKRKYPTVYVTSPDLVNVELAGSGDFKCSGPVDTDNLNIQLNGSGDVDFKGAVICDHLKVSVNGSGDVDIKQIEALTSQVELIGSGDIKIGEKNVGTTTLQLIGSGDIKMDFDQCHDVTSSIVGSGDIELRGKITGRLMKSKAGSGDYHIYL